MYPLISVIVPIYKAEPYLAQCLLSIAHQTYQNLEVFLINDGSPDRCGEICEQYARLDPRFRVIHQPNQGVSSARNRGIEHAAGEWLTFVDADDWLEPDMIKRLQISGNLHEEIDMVVGNTYKNYLSAQTALMDSGDTFVAQNKNELLAAVLSGSGLDGADMRGPCGKLYRHQLIKEHALRFSHCLAYGEDMIFNLEILSCVRRLAVDKNAYYHYRMSTESACRSYSPITIERTDKLIKQCAAIIGDNQALCAANQSGVVRLMMACCDGYFFHPDNPDPLANRLSQLKGFFSREPYATAVALKNNPYLTKRQRMITFLAKRRWVVLLWFMYQCKGVFDRLLGKVSRAGAAPAVLPTICKE